MSKKIAENEEAKVENVVSSPEVETTKPKKGKNIALKVSIISVIVALLVVGGFFAYRIFMSKDPVKVTSKAIRGLKDNIADFKSENSDIVKMIEKSDAVEVSSEISVDLPKEIGKDYFVDLLAQFNKDADSIKLDIAAKEDSTTILDISALIDAAKVYFKLNDTMSNYYFTKLDETVSSFDINNIPQLPDYDYENIINYLADAIDGSLSSKDFTKEKDELTIKDKDVKVTKYTTEIDEVKLKAIVDKFLDKVSSDKELIKALVQLTGADEKEIKDSIAEVKKMKASELGDISLNYSVYVTSSGETVGYGFYIEGINLIFAEYNDVLSIQLSAKGMGGTLEFEEVEDDHYVATLNVMGGMVSGELDIKSEDETIKKGEEYKNILEVNLKLSAMGETIKGSVKAETTVKAIDKVDTSAKLNAKSIDDLSTAEQETFVNEVLRSKSYNFLEGLMSSFEESAPVINY